MKKYICFGSIGQKGMTFDHKFGYPFPLFFFLKNKREEEKENEIVKIVFKSHAFLPDLLAHISPTVALAVDYL